MRGTTVRELCWCDASDRCHFHRYGGPRCSALSSMLSSALRSPLASPQFASAQQQPVTACAAVATFPEDTHPPIVYPFALKTVAKGEGPARFLSFLQTDAARTVFTSQGFSLLPSGSGVKEV